MRARSLLQFATFLIASVPANRSVAQSRPNAESQPTLELRGRVLDAEGAPIKEAGLVVGPKNRTATVDALTRPTAKTDADGRFAVRISSKASSSQIVLVAAPGRISAGQTLLTWPWGMLFGGPAEQAVDLGDLRLPHGVTVKGRVRKIDGSPIPGALVRAEDMLRSHFSPGSASLMGQAVTDATGGFTLPAVFPLANSITVEADGYYSQTAPSVNAGEPLLITLVESGFVEGKVQDEKRMPFEGQLMMLHEFQGAAWIHEPLVGGSFRLPVRSRGRFRIFASREGDRTCIAASDYLDGPAQGLILRPHIAAKEGYSVRAIDSATGKPITKFRAGAWWHGGRFEDHMESWLDDLAEEAGSDGLVILAEPDPEERHSSVGVLRARATGHAPLTVEQFEWKKGEVFDALLAPESRLEGRVLDETSGQPIAGASVSWARAGQKQRYRSFRPAASLATGPDGTFTIPELGPGSYELTVHRPRSTVVESTIVEVQAGATRTGIEIKVPAGVALAGKIVGARVGADWRLVLAPNRKRGELDLDEETPWPDAARVTTIGPDGSFRFERLGQGEETLSLEIPAPPRTGADLRA